MKNKITDVNNHLIAQLERLSDEDLSKEDLEKEIQRSKAIANIGETIIKSAQVTVDAMKILDNNGVDLTDTSAAALFVNNPNQLKP